MRKSVAAHPLQTSQNLVLHGTRCSFEMPDFPIGPLVLSWDTMGSSADHLKLRMKGKSDTGNNLTHVRMRLDTLQILFAATLAFDGAILIRQGIKKPCASAKVSSRGSVSLMQQVLLMANLFRAFLPQPSHSVAPQVFIQQLFI